MAIGFDKALGIHPQALALRAERANHLANNLANAETPNYQAKDFDFATALQQLKQNTSTHARSQQLGASHSRQGHSESSPVTLNETSVAIDERPTTIDEIVEQHLQYRLPTQDSVDGNTVDENHEQAEFMQNALGYQTSFTLLNGKFKGLMTAIRGD